MLDEYTKFKIIYSPILKTEQYYSSVCKSEWNSLGSSLWINMPSLTRQWDEKDPGFLTAAISLCPFIGRPYDKLEAIKYLTTNYNDNLKTW